MLDALFSTVAPHPCCSCVALGSLLCHRCEDNIVNDFFMTCLHCAAPTPGGVCAHHRLPYLAAWHMGARDGVLRTLIDEYKFRYRREAAGILANIMHRSAPALPDNAIIVPIPTHRTHVRERGFDHALLLAKKFARRRRMPVQQLLRRETSTVQRASTKKVRLQQARHAFSVKGVLDSAPTYVLLDDVVTTGATVNAAARELRQAGAKHVWVFAMCRQPLD